MAEIPGRYGSGWFEDWLTLESDWHVHDWRLYSIDGPRYEHEVPADYATWYCTRCREIERRSFKQFTRLADSGRDS